ncbi:tryptophan synthase subunit alpha [Nonlabens xiamenensis]|uniref:tryptophan synthase subunit alpha n=1 Tax=Nonlabens xiamenensis TaxID=2341043 RepID=UPI000F61273A|nr:tryptophan synthase subunit alpha [Nonlabens xiamenensis]
MKNKLTELLATKPSQLLNIFFTAGYPQIEDTNRILSALATAGVDLVEIGIPFSDPLADGPTIQESSKKALENGMSIERLLSQLEKQDLDLPVLLMGYLNPILQYGMKNFCKRCQEVGVDGLIIPDLPLQIYLNEFSGVFEEHSLSNIFLVTPQTSEQRIREIDRHSTGFIYAVSSASTTGSKNQFATATDYLKKLKDMQLETPILTGFNIKTQSDFKTACEYVDGAIIGSEFIRQISHGEPLEDKVKGYVQSIR